MGEKFAMNLKNEQMTLQEITPEYEAFVEKFKPKKTTDDCFTPPLVWDAVAEWVEKEYGVDRSKFVDPFYPGGDYQRFFYSDDCIVVANPPFSIITEIKRSSGPWCNSSVISNKSLVTRDKSPPTF